MPNNVSIYAPRTMGRLIQKLPPVRTFLRSTFFKNEQTFVTESVDVDFKKGSRKVAPFVSRVIGGKIVPNTGYETKTYTPPLIAPEKVTTVDDLLKRMPGENIYSGMTPEQRAVRKLADDLLELQEMVDRRIELMCAQTIFTGQIPIIGDGVNEVISFDFTNLDIITTATKKWTNASSDPIADLRAWHKEVQKKGCLNCNMCIMGEKVYEAFSRHEKVVQELDTKNAHNAIIQPKQLENGVTYMGTIHELGLDIYQYNEWYLDEWTNPKHADTKPLVPENRLALLSTNAEYSMYYGAITIADKKTDSFRTIEGKVVPDTWMERRPNRRMLNLSSAPLCVPHDVDSWFVAQPV